MSTVASTFVVAIIAVTAISADPTNVSFVSQTKFRSGVVVWALIPAHFVLVSRCSQGGGRGLDGVVASYP